MDSLGQDTLSIVVSFSIDTPCPQSYAFVRADPFAGTYEGTKTTLYIIKMAYSSVARSTA